MSSEEGGSKVKVVVRIRPQLKGETNGAPCVQIDAQNCLLLQNLKAGKNAEVFKYKFDSCYEETASQETLFENEVQPLLDNLFQGLNTTIFAYGVTGAGKTHTMQGSPELPGIIPRSVESVINFAKSKEPAKGSKSKNAAPACSISVSYLEIYNEKVYDLLAPKDQDLPIREDQSRNIFIPSLEEVQISTLDDFHKTYAAGCRNRTTASTKLNAKSSRSHAILIMKVQYKETQAPHRTFIGKLHLIDLAGSEDNRRTDNKGIRLTESSNINQSLFVLGKVVHALNKGLNRIPYRDSKLTRLLQDSLGGNSYSVMIANVAPGQAFFFDTYNTLNFASKSRLIVNRPTVNTEQEEKPTIIEEEEIESRKKSKRKTENSSEDSKRKLLRSEPSIVANKENIKNIENRLEKRIELLLEQKLKNSLLSPYFRDYKVLDGTTQARLERLERKLIEQTEEVAEHEIDRALSDEEEEEEEEEENVREVKYDLLTPCSKVKTAKELIIRAKELEKFGDLTQSLIDYREAARLLPANDKLAAKLKKKISQLEETLNTNAEDDILIRKPGIKEISKKLLLYDDDDEDERRSSDSSERQNRSRDSSGRHTKRSRVSDTDDSTKSKEKQILYTLNNGSYEELLDLHCIGEARAKKIIEYREETPFTKLNDLKNVGFGVKMFSTFCKKNIEE